MITKRKNWNTLQRENRYAIMTVASLMKANYTWLLKPGNTHTHTHTPSLVSLIKYDQYKKLILVNFQY